ncbi:hypothetical protein HDG32_001889 [Paraburkholderia sp. CI2]|uniref:hypothetical protein n=1 Tax=Paraburkholderia sp. CI2 TaxID=2723093 RepID=UPI001609AD78|nr:hypothetical protein [Paraburkholderia sp. CI2]MBB5465782.1 hypothetical protein [Paraburkholderia sp. CI2]
MPAITLLALGKLRVMSSRLAETVRLSTSLIWNSLTIAVRPARKPVLIQPGRRHRRKQADIRMAMAIHAPAADRL